MDINENDTRFLRVMKSYFEAKTQAANLKRRLEEARKSADSKIADFYDPRVNWAWAEEIARIHALKAEMNRLMVAAEAWANGEVFDVPPSNHMRDQTS
ncbi:hypothetical protein [Pararhizobium antarcticum]|uniref:Uncharacterized protein n=1 Tax=Pararhizobium antarcticum TaxID=1798805 RepID=A0A657LT82_9HYPH|nr:hypothetical protein [Pararhizobium antarcticum]OJF96233.1 hypothetical protein AX761_16115 [Rhizobium sp. 58]OJF97777.1 hypothetical protein AX760_16080 [Pararhizobium antarcticum]